MSLGAKVEKYKGHLDELAEILRAGSRHHSDDASLADIATAIILERDAALARVRELQMHLACANRSHIGCSECGNISIPCEPGCAIREALKDAP